MIVAGLRKPEQFNRTRIHLILFFAFIRKSLWFPGRGGRNPFRAMKLLDTDYCADKSLNCLAVVVVLYCACEGSKQRFVPTGLGSR